MNSQEVLNYLAVICKRRNAQFDVLPCDKLRDVNILKYPCCLVVNNQPSTEGGQHWIAFYINDKSAMVEFYDSFGMGISYYPKEFNDFVIRMDRRVRENIVKLQSYESTVCGHYCIYFIWERLNGFSPKAVYARFSNNCKINDDVVNNFIKAKKYLLNKKCI